NSGDVLQIFKAGIMEIADLFVINKADLQGVGKLKSLLRELVMMTSTVNYKTPIIKTKTIENKGIDELWQKIKEHHHYLYQTEEGRSRRIEQQELEVYELIREEIWREVKSFIEQQGDDKPLIKKIKNHTKLRNIGLKSGKRKNVIPLKNKDDVLSSVKDSKLIKKRRNQMIQGAITLFKEKGFHRTTTREIAKESGFSIGTLYEYIRTKEDVLYLVSD